MRRRLAERERQGVVSQSAVWRSWATRTGPADRPAAERAIVELYRRHGRAAPRFVWVASPLTGMLAVWLLSAAWISSPQPYTVVTVGEALGDPVWQEIGVGFRDSMWGSVTTALRDLSGDLQLRDLGRPVGPPVPERMLPRWELQAVPPARWHDGDIVATLDADAARTVRPSAWRGAANPTGAGHWLVPFSGEVDLRLFNQWYSTVGRVVNRSVHAWRPDPVASSIAYGLREASAIRLEGQGAAYWVGTYTILRQLGLARYRPEADRILDLYGELVRSCGYWWPYPQVCVICERPVRFAVVERAGPELLLDGGNEPALEYADGFAVA